MKTILYSLITLCLIVSPGTAQAYVTLNGNRSDFTFQGDTTYYVNGATTLSGTTTIEGGAVIKYERIRFNPSINITGSVICKASQYHPAILTAKDDNTVGETIGNSTGNPSGYYASTALQLPVTGGSAVSNLRILYAQTAILSYNEINHTYPADVLKHIQIIHCGIGLLASGVGLIATPQQPQSQAMGGLGGVGGAQPNSNGGSGGTHPPRNVYLGNVLFSDVGQIVTGQSATVTMEQLTADQSACIAGGTSVNVTVRNSIFANVSQAITGGATIAGNNNGFFNSSGAQFGSTIYTTTASPFQPVGAGNYYLNPNTFQGDGTTGINAQLLADLKTRTTYPPVIYASRLLSTIPSGTTFNPQALRNTGLPDLGYHYDPLDYVFQNCEADAYAYVTFTSGTAIGWQGQGLHVSDGYYAYFNFNGTLAGPCYFVRANTVQEADASGDGTGIAGSSVWSYVSATFTRFSALDDMAAFFDANAIAASAHYNDNNEFWGGQLGGNVTGGLQLTCYNCLFDRSRIQFLTTAASPNSTLQLWNCTLHGGTLTMNNFNNSTAVNAFDSAFDGTAIAVNGVSVNAAYNAYLSGADTLPTDHDDVTMSGGFNWQGGYFGSFYLPAGSPLINHGNQTANGISVYTGYGSSLASLATFTTQVDGTPEGGSPTDTVDIGYHYPALLAKTVNQQLCPNDSFNLSGYNPDVYGLPLTYSVVTPPAHGGLSGTPSDLVYAPSGYIGTDGFTYKISNGLLTSPPTAVAVIAGDPSPVASQLKAITGVGQSVTLILGGSDFCGDPLTFAVVSGPAHGHLNPAIPTPIDAAHASVAYQPDTSPLLFKGVDTFNFTVNGGAGVSFPNTVTILVTPGPVLTADCRPRGIALTWDMTTIEPIFNGQSVNITGFNVYRSTTPGGPYALLTPAPLGSQERHFEDTSVVPNTTYYYVVTYLCYGNFQGINTTYESPYSAQVSKTTCCQPATGGLWTEAGATPQEMAQWIMSGNPVTVQNAHYTGDPQARGFFGGGNSVGLNGNQFPIDHGVILASGNIANAIGPNDRPDASSAFGLPGDSDLDNLYGGNESADAAILEFDFVSTSSFQLQIQYIFASEEYTEFIYHQYVDPMAIFITTNHDGLITPADNIALIPNTDTAINVHTVNSTEHSEFYVDNHDPVNSPGIPPYNLQYDGFTTLLSAQANIAANVTYHVKIAIEDYADDTLDSAVFIKTSMSISCP